MANRKHPEGTAGNVVAGPDIADAAQRAGLAIRDLQSRLGVRMTEQKPEAGEAVAPADELDRQLKNYFDRTGAIAPNVPPSVLNALREKVVEGVVERILSEWKQPGSKPGSKDETPLLGEVIDRLIARVMVRLGASDI